MKVLSTDIVTIGTRVFRRVQVKVPTGKFTKTGRPRMRTDYILEPVNVEAHVNPVGLGVLAALGTAGLVLLAGRLQLPTPFGSIEFYKGPFAEEFETWKAAWNQRRNDKYLRSCGYLEQVAVGLETQGIPIASGMNCRELETLAGCNLPHSRAAQEARDKYCR